MRRQMEGKSRHLCRATGTRLSREASGTAGTADARDVIVYAQGHPACRARTQIFICRPAQVAELQTLRDFARGQGKRDGVTAMLCGAHGGLKCAARYSEEMKARVMTPATRSMHGHATGFGRGQQSRNVRGRLGRRRRRGFAPRHHDGGSGHSNEKGHLDRGGYGTGHRGCRGHNRA